MPDLDLTTDHKALDDDLAARRYFAKFGRITRLLTGVAAEMRKDRSISALDSEVLEDYVRAIAATFKALSLKALAPFSQGLISDEVLGKIGTDLAAIK